ncbi:MAG: Glu-tRNA(Gln) amidotransferase GatDE subunit E, partial [Euryarchaeota archaeon]|nr:Glu-tRNA(Gln) amidotransferase GatDE subunit E [Euryarchaeota archaeon]
SVVAITLVGTLKDLKRDGYETESISREKLKEVFKAVAENKITKEAIPEVLAALARSPDKKVEEIAGIKYVEAEEVVKIVRRILQERKEFVMERGLDAAKPLMGVVMQEVRGRMDGKLVSEMLQRELKKFLGK